MSSFVAIDAIDRPLSRRLLSTFDINDDLLWKLIAKGFTLKSEIEVLSDDKLKTICDLTEEELNSINNKIRNSHKSPLNYRTLSEMNGSPNGRIHTSSQTLDNILCGGLEVSNITQICGEGGVGKTQLCMQLCINVQMPEPLGGLSGHALYIDTENNLRPERLKSMANFCLESHPELKECLSLDSMISSIHYICCNTNSNDLFDLIVTKLETHLDLNPQIKLIVIDSIAQLFRYDYKGSETEKDYELSEIAHKLRGIAHNRKIAILITNQLTYSTREERDVPSLGKLWQTYCSKSLLIKRQFFSPSRIGSVLKSTDFQMRDNFYFEITENGIKEGLEVQECLS